VLRVLVGYVGVARDRLEAAQVPPVDRAEAGSCGLVRPIRLGHGFGDVTRVEPRPNRAGAGRSAPRRRRVAGAPRRTGQEDRAGPGRRTAPERAERRREAQVKIAHMT